MLEFDSVTKQSRHFGVGKVYTRCSLGVGKKLTKHLVLQDIRAVWCRYVGKNKKNYLEIVL